MFMYYYCYVRSVLCVLFHCVVLFVNELALAHWDCCGKNKQTNKEVLKAIS